MLLGATIIIETINFGISFIYFFHTVFQSSSEMVTPLEIKTSYGDNNDTFIIELSKSTIGKNTTLQVNLKFFSQLSSTLQGFYQVSYEDSDSDTKK